MRNRSRTLWIAWRTRLAWPTWLALAWFVVGGCTERAPAGTETDAGIGVADALQGGDLAGYARATEPPELRFPRDHGPHAGFRTEWWYFTANLAAADGRAFSAQLVFFRQALAPPAQPTERNAALAARELVLAHAALGDVAGQRFWRDERLLRRDGVRADVAGPPLALFCGDWSAIAEPTGSAAAPEVPRDGTPTDGLLPVRLTAAFDGVAFTLRLTADKGLVLQGDRGLSQKSAEPGNASIYYSLPRLAVAGEVAVDGGRVAVTGSAWCDREWSTSALGAGQVGWDWFSLQLDDRTELMWYRLRREDGGEDPHSQGLFVRADGGTQRLSSGDVRATPLGTWQSADGVATYPMPWRLTVPALGLDLRVEPRQRDQELRTIVRYWEGAVTATGTRDGRPVTGLGFLEMTGYAGVPR